MLLYLSVSFFRMSGIKESEIVVDGDHLRDRGRRSRRRKLIRDGVCVAIPVLFRVPALSVLCISVLLFPFSHLAHARQVAPLVQTQIRSRIHKTGFFLRRCTARLARIIPHTLSRIPVSLSLCPMYQNRLVPVSPRRQAHQIIPSKSCRYSLVLLDLACRNTFSPRLLCPTK